MRVHTMATRFPRLGERDRHRPFPFNTRGTKLRFWAVAYLLDSSGASANRVPTYKICEPTERA